MVSLKYTAKLLQNLVELKIWKLGPQKFMVQCFPSFKFFHVSSVNTNFCFPLLYLWLIISCAVPHQNLTSEVPDFVFWQLSSPGASASPTYLPRKPQVWGMGCLLWDTTWSFLILFLRPLTIQCSIALTQKEPRNTNNEHLNLLKRARLQTVTSLNLKNILFKAPGNPLHFLYSFMSDNKVNCLLTWLLGKSSRLLPKSCKAADGSWSRQ